MAASVMAKKSADSDAILGSPILPAVGISSCAIDIGCVNRRDFARLGAPARGVVCTRASSGCRVRPRRVSVTRW